MKKSSTKILALCLSAIVVVGGIGVTAYALDSGNGKEVKQAEQETVPDAENQEISKDETVYVISGADGSVQKVIVSDWIKNAIGTDKEDYTADGETMRVWDAEGNDIYYQGDIQKELPVDMSVTYTLDGKQISPEELAHKSGRVTIRFDYENKQYEDVNVDGRQERIYVPFAMLTGVLLDDDVFKNVEVSNGKLLNDGSRTAVIGIAFPGLQENLAVPEAELDIPDYVEISADTTDFQLDMTATLATNGLFNEIDTGSIDSVSDLSKSMNQLTGAMDQLINGSSKLYDGLATLLEKSGELTDGIDQLAAGAKSLKDGAGSLDSGAAELKQGAEQLRKGLNTLVSNNDDLNGGAKQVFDTLLSTANTQLKSAGLDVPTLTVNNYDEVLSGLIASLDKNAVYNKALGQVTAAVEAQKDTIKQQVTAAVKEQVTAQVTEAVKNTVAEQVIQADQHMDKKAYEEGVAAGRIGQDIQTRIETAINAKMQSPEVTGQIQAGTDTQMKSDAVKKTIEEQTELQIQKIVSEKMASDEVQSQLAAASEGAKQVISLKSSLDSYNTFYRGLQSYTAGVADAATGAGALEKGTDELKAGTSKLCDGTSELYKGIGTMKKGAPALTGGITKLRDGAMQLSGGLKELNEKGIQKLVDAVNGDLKGLVARFRATGDVSKRYRSFSDTNGDIGGQVKFIYKTDAID